MELRNIISREFKEELKVEEKKCVDMPQLITRPCDFDFDIETRLQNEILYWLNITKSKGVRYIDESKNPNLPYDPQSKIIFINCPVGKSVQIGRRDILTNVLVANNPAILNVTQGRPLSWYSISNQYFFTIPEPMISDETEKELCLNGMFLCPKRLF